MTTTRILLIDDHALFRAGLRMVLSSLMTETVIFESGTLTKALADTPEVPDVILLDIHMPGLNGVEGIALLKRRWPSTKVLMLSAQYDSEIVQLALTRGASDFISKASNSDKIVSAIEHVLQGAHAKHFAHDVAEYAADSAPQHLTPRQCEVLELVCLGLSNKLIARQLSVSENTVRNHVQGILAFLQVSSRSEAAFAARNRGLVG
jgi:DNA-binding NarL/FixJ family response regulator